MTNLKSRFRQFIGFDDVAEYDDEEEAYVQEEDTDSAAEAVLDDDDFVVAEKSRYKNISSTSRLNTSSRGFSSQRNTSDRSAVSFQDTKEKEEGHKMVGMGNSQGLRVVLSKPTEFDNCQAICSHLRAQMTIVLNLEYVTNTGDRKRIFDFVSGCCYALDGNIQKVSDLIYIIAPCHVDVFAELNEAEAEADGDVDRAYSLFN